MHIYNLVRPSFLTVVRIFASLTIIAVVVSYKQYLDIAAHVITPLQNRLKLFMVDIDSSDSKTSIGDNTSGIQSIDLSGTNYTHLPKIVWMLWDKGWDKAPRLQAMCLRSWERHQNNTSFKIIKLDLPTAERLIQRTTFYSNAAWKAASIQAKSDIIRLELLARFGGVWADASVYCNEPLYKWLPSVLNSTDFFMFERHDGNVKPKLKPWISSWFIAAINTSFVLQTWLTEVRSAWSTIPYASSVYGYFWAHRLFTKLVNNDGKFKNEYSNMFPYDAAGPHCFFKQLPVYLRNVTPPVYKAKAGSCGNVKKRLFEFEKSLDNK